VRYLFIVIATAALGILAYVAAVLIIGHPIAH